jgi:hypothetical protein
MRRAAGSVPPRVSGLYRMSLEELSAEANRVLAATSSTGLPSGGENTSSSSGGGGARAKPAAVESRSGLHPLFAVVPACAIAATFVHIATGYELQDDWRRPNHHQQSLPASGSMLRLNDSAPPVPTSRTIPAPAAEPALPVSAPTDPKASQRSLEHSVAKTTQTARTSSAPSELAEYQASLGTGVFVYVSASTLQLACLSSLSPQLTERCCRAAILQEHFQSSEARRR